MLIFLIVILLLAALLEYRSLRGGTACVDGEIFLSETRVEADTPVTLTVTAEISSTTEKNIEECKKNTLLC